MTVEPWADKRVEKTAGKMADLMVDLLAVLKVAKTVDLTVFRWADTTVD